MKKLLLSVVVVGSLFANNFINLQITNSTIMAEAQTLVSHNKPFYVKAGFLAHADKSNFYYAGIKSEGQIIGVDVPATFSLFIDAVHTKNNTAIPMGVGFSTYLDKYTIPIFVRGEYEYAPKILSFDDANRFSKYKGELGIRFIENGEIFAGYRHISFDKVYNSAIYVGIGLSF